MKPSKTLSLLAAGLLSASISHAAIFTFDDESTAIGGGIDGLTTGSFTVDGIEITATSTTGEPFNATGSFFGINSAGGGDDSAGIDVGETFTLGFDQAVNLLNFDVSSWSAGNDSVTIADGGTIVATISSTGTTSLGSYLLGASNTLTITTTAEDTATNGWSFDFIEVTAVPEPSSYAMLAGLLALGFVATKRRK